jgi:hypothetical protein
LSPFIYSGSTAPDRPSPTVFSASLRTRPHASRHQSSIRTSAAILIAIAIDPLTGCPTNHNGLIGELYLKTLTGLAANLAAISIQALERQPAACDQTSVTTEIRFDGYNYQLLPTTMAVDHLPSPADGLESLLIIDRIEGSLVTGMRTIGDLAGVVYNDLEVGQSIHGWQQPPPAPPRSGRFNTADNPAPLEVDSKRANRMAEVFTTPMMVRSSVLS